MLHKCLLAILTLTSVLLASCAPAPTLAPPPPPTATARTEPLLQPQVVSSPSTAEGTATETQTPTPEPFALDLTPIPSETALPTLQLPTEAAHLPTLVAWDGLPTYLADSNPGYYFRVQFDPNAWALTTDSYGSPSLAHRAIRNCIIAPTAGRGLPPNATVSQDVRKINGISYQISTVSVNGAAQSVTYTGGEGHILTAFQVSLDERPDQCLLEAETVLGTLTSIPISQATPIISTP